MTIRVQIEGKGQVAEFPDGTNPAIIDAAIKRDYFGGAAPRKAPEDSRTGPEWSGRHPNLYGVFGAGKELLRTGIESGMTTLGAAGGALIPAPGTTLLGAGSGYAAGKRGVNLLYGEPVDISASGIAADIVLGGAFQGLGKLAGKIPYIGKIIAPQEASVGTVPTGSGLLEKTAKTVAEKTLKIPPSGKVGYHTINREKAVGTMLEEGVRVTKGGLKRVQGLTDDLLDEMDNAVANNPSAIIKTDSVLGPVNELKDWATKTVNGDKLAKQIDKVISNFKTQYGDEITVAQAQEIKQNTNRWLRKSYGELKAPVEEAQKQIVRGLKDRIAQEIPEITGINMKYGDLKNLEIALERAVNRTGNWDWFSLSAGMAGTVVGGATGNIAKASEAVALWRFLKSPIVQSQLALTLSKMGKAKEANFMANAITETVYKKMTE